MMDLVLYNNTGFLGGLRDRDVETNDFFQKVTDKKSNQDERHRRGGGRCE